MRRTPLTPTATALGLGVALLLAACTTTPQPTPSPTPASTGASGPATGTATSPFPGCDAITAALGALVDGLTYDADVSKTNTADEAYAQRVCVYVTADGATQLGVTIAAIPFQQTELDAYATLPNAIDDDRLDQYGAVLQTFDAKDADDGHLDGPLYLFDTAVSITIQGRATAGGTAATLPQLTIPAAVDAALAVRALL